jgi:hypothetical protein
LLIATVAYAKYSAVAIPVKTPPSSRAAVPGQSNPMDAGRSRSANGFAIDVPVLPGLLAPADFAVRSGLA